MAGNSVVSHDWNIGINLGRRLIPIFLRSTVFWSVLLWEGFRVCATNPLCYWECKPQRGLRYHCHSNLLPLGIQIACLELRCPSLRTKMCLKRIPATRHITPSFLSVMFSFEIGIFTQSTHYHKWAEMTCLKFKNREWSFLLILISTFSYHVLSLNDMSEKVLTWYFTSAEPCFVLTCTTNY